VGLREDVRCGRVGGIKRGRGENDTYFLLNETKIYFMYTINSFTFR